MVVAPRLLKADNTSMAGGRGLLQLDTLRCLFSNKFWHASRFYVYLDQGWKHQTSVNVDQDMHNFVHKVNWVIKWMIKGLNFYGKLVDIFNKSAFNIFPKFLHL